MPAPVRLKLSAVEDLAEGYAWYESQRPGLGEDFLAAVGRCLDSIARHPLGNAVVIKNIRQAQAKPFPYSVFYRVTTEEIVVRAIMHNARNPSQWRKRLRRED